MSPFARVASWLGGLLPERWSRGGGEGTETSSDSAAARSRPRAGWQQLAPLRTPRHRRPAEVSQVTRFAQGLRADHRSPGSLAPLGHHVTRAAPRGVATGIARAVTTTVERAAASSGAATNSGGVDLPLRRQRAEPTPRPSPRQSRVSTPATPETSPARTDGAIPAGEPEQASTSSGPAGAGPDQVSAATDPGLRRTPRPPVRVLRATDTDLVASPVASAGATVPRDLPLRKLGSPSRGSRAAAAPDPGSGRDDAGAAAAVAGNPPDASDDHRRQQDPGDADQRPTVGSSPIVVGRDAPPSAPRPDAQATPPRDSPSERAGVGEPLRRLPPSARPVGSGNTRGERSVTGRGRSEAVSRGLQRWVAGPTHDVAGDEALAGSGPTGSSTADRPRPPGPPVVAASLPAVHRTVEDRPGPLAPTVGSTPLVEQSDPPGPRGAPAGDEGPVAAAPVPVRWRDATPASATDTAARPGGTPGMTDHADGGGSPRRAQPAVMRAGIGTGTTTGPATGRTEAAGSAAPVRLGDRTSDDRRRSAGTAGRGAPVRVPDGPSDSDAGSGNRARLPLPQLPRILRRSVNGHAEAATAAAGSGGGPALEAAATGARSGPPGPPAVHRQAAEPVGDASPSGGPPPSASTPGAAPPDETGDDTEPAEGTDALFRKLYPRVRDELRWELRVQRERAGMLSDPL